MGFIEDILRVDGGRRDGRGRDGRFGQGDKILLDIVFRDTTTEHLDGNTAIFVRIHRCGLFIDAFRRESAQTIVLLLNRQLFLLALFNATETRFSLFDDGLGILWQASRKLCPWRCVLYCIDEGTATKVREAMDELFNGIPIGIRLSEFELERRIRRETFLHHLAEKVHHRDAFFAKHRISRSLWIRLDGFEIDDFFLSVQAPFGFFEDALGISSFVVFVNERVLFDDFADVIWCLLGFQEFFGDESVKERIGVSLIGIKARLDILTTFEVKVLRLSVSRRGMGFFLLELVL